MALAIVVEPVLDDVAVLYLPIATPTMEPDTLLFRLGHTGGQTRYIPVVTYTDLP